MMFDLIKVVKKREELKEKDFEFFNVSSRVIFNINGEIRRRGRLYCEGVGGGSWF